MSYSCSSNNNDFKLVVPRFKNERARKSALFNFIIDKFKAGQTVDLNCKLTVKPSYILVEFEQNKDPHNLSFEPEYKLKEAHLRIDEGFFSAESSKDKLTYSHYTEIYSKKDYPDITVHIYFHHGIFESMWCKKDGAYNVKIIDQIKIAQGMSNSHAARLFITDRLYEMVDHRNKLELQLEHLLDNALNVKSTADIMANIEECKLVSSALNRFLENYQDQRANKLESIATKIMQQQELESTEQHETSKEIVGTECKVTTANHLKNKPTIIRSEQQIMAFNPIITKIERLITIYRLCGENATDLLKIHAQLKDINDDLTVLYIKNTNIGSLTKFKYAKKRLSLIPSLKTKFNEFIKAGKVENVKLLFENVKNSLSSKDYIQFFIQITVLSNKSIESNYVEICNFLYNNSDEYRIFISLMQKAELYFVGLNIFPCAYLALNDNYDLFVTIIRQIGTADIDSIYVNNMAFPLLNHLLLLKVDEKYITFLLECNANVNSKPGSELRIANNNEQAKRFSFDDSKHTSPKFDYKVILAFMEYHSALPIACARVPSSNLLASLIPPSDLKNIILSFFILQMNTQIKTLMVMTDDQSEEKFAVIDNIQPGFQGESKSSFLTLKFGIPKTKDENPVEKSALKEFVRIINSKIQGLALTQLEELSITLMMFALAQMNKGYYYNSIAAYNAVILVTTFMESTKKMHERIARSLLNIAACHSKDGHRQTADNNYALARIFVENSMFKDEIASILEQANNQSVRLRS